MKKYYDLYEQIGNTSLYLFSTIDFYEIQDYLDIERESLNIDIEDSEAMSNFYSNYTIKEVYND